MTCKRNQQFFYENLGTRDYDCFEENEDKYLKLKIGFILYGTPEENENMNNLDGDYTVAQIYDQKQNILINKLYSVIKSKSIYNENKDQVLISFLFNCCEFQRKKLEDEEKIACFPVFRVRKCTGSPENKNCCVYIDEKSRVYKNWNDYLENNKIPKCKMFVPKDGKYQGNSDDEVLLEELLSPACAVKEKIIKVADISTTATSLVTGGIAIGSLIPAVTVAPIVLTGALLAGAGVGVYSIVRSSLVLHDRNMHDQSISLANNEARNCYLNIAAGATSVITTGATKAATFALGRGVIITETAATALMSVNAINMTVNGCNVANSIYSIVSDIKNKKKPSALDIMHLTTTVLFFGNAVVNFKSACVIYKDTQSTRSFADLIRSQSDDLWSRAKSKFFKADMTSIDNNSSVKNINNTGDYCSNVISFPVKERAADFVQNTAFDLLINVLREIDYIELGQIIIKNYPHVQQMCKLILSRFENAVQEIMIILLKYLLKDIIQAAYDVLDQIFPKTEKVVVILNFIINFLKFKVSEMEIDYYQKKAETIRELNISEDEYDKKYDGFKSSSQRMTYFLTLVVMRMICENGKPHEILFREMVKYFWDWLSEKAMEYTIKISQQNNQPLQNIIERKIIPCSDCGGFYYID